MWIIFLKNIPLTLRLISQRPKLDVFQRGGGTSASYQDNPILGKLGMIYTPSIPTYSGGSLTLNEADYLSTENLKINSVGHLLDLESWRPSSCATR